MSSLDYLGPQTAAVGAAVAIDQNGDALSPGGPLSTPTYQTNGAQFSVYLASVDIAATIRTKIAEAARAIYSQSILTNVVFVDGGSLL